MSKNNVSLGSVCANFPLNAIISAGDARWQLRKDYQKSSITYLISLTKDTPTLTLAQAKQFYINGEDLHVALPNQRSGERLDSYKT